MKYILMINTMKAGRGGSRMALQAHIAFVKSFDKELRESGELVSARRLVLSGSSQACADWQGWGADHRRRVSGGQGVSCWLLDRGCRHSRASLCDRRTSFVGAGTRWGAVEHAH
jgi:hypothetical protein